MSKQDRTHSRTPADAENKFLRNLGKTFAEIMGIATDARTTAEGTRSELTKAVASINKEITDKSATIELQAKTITEQGESIANLQTKATEQEASIGLQAEKITEQGENIANLQIKANEQGASIGLLVDNNGVKGSVIVEAINGQSSAKIKADNIVFEGQKLDIKVDATNIESKLTAEQIDADGIKAENVEISGKVTANEGKVGEWILGEAEIPYLHLDGTEHKKPAESALYSGEQRYEHDNGFNIKETWLTARGVYTKSRHYSCDVIINDVYYDELLTGTNYDERTWSGLLEGSNGETVSETWIFTLDNGTTVEKSVCINNIGGN